MRKTVVVVLSSIVAPLLVGAFGGQRDAIARAQAAALRLRLQGDSLAGEECRREAEQAAGASYIGVPSTHNDVPSTHDDRWCVPIALLRIAMTRVRVCTGRLHVAIGVRHMPEGRLCASIAPWWTHIRAWLTPSTPLVVHISPRTRTFAACTGASRVRRPAARCCRPSCGVRSPHHFTRRIVWEGFREPSPR